MILSSIVKYELKKMEHTNIQHDLPLSGQLKLLNLVASLKFCKVLEYASHSDEQILKRNNIEYAKLHTITLLENCKHVS